MPGRLTGIRYTTGQTVLLSCLDPRYCSLILITLGQESSILLEVLIMNSLPLRGMRQWPIIFVLLHFLIQNGIVLSSER